MISPSMALGQAVHEVIESLSNLPVDKRFTDSINDKFEIAWKKVSGKKGGFTNEGVENEFKKRGKAIIDKIRKSPGPLKNLSVKIKMDLPHYWLSPEDNCILCGKIDWLEYIPETDSVHIIDFKTSKYNEDENSLQLPIYYLLVKNCQKRNATKASYWYVERDDTPIEVLFPDINSAVEKLKKIAREIKLAKTFGKFKCPHENGCYACKPMEAITRGEAVFVGVDEYKHDTFILEKEVMEEKIESVIL